MHNRQGLAFAIVLSCLLLPISRDTLATPPTDFLTEIRIVNLVEPMTTQFLPDNRMLVITKPGIVWVVQPGQNQVDPVPFLQLTNIETSGENGLQGLTLDPDFAQNGYIYVFYTFLSPRWDRVSRFTVAGNTVVPGSEVLVWSDNQLTGGSHHGGSLAFGPDGYLYLSVGEHFVSASAQSFADFRGKILRVDLSGTPPSSNPFYTGLGQPNDYIWAMGLRNPFRITFDSVTGRLLIGDVGGNVQSTAVEEVNEGVPGANYGWPICEGPCAIPGITSPIHSYPHGGQGASIAGGVVYRGSSFPPQYFGSYFFTDYVRGWMRELTFDAAGNVTGENCFEPADCSASRPLNFPVHTSEGPDGALYVTDYGGGRVLRIRYVGANQPPVITASASPLAGLPPLSVAFSSTGTFDPEGQSLSYDWDFGDGTQSQQSSPVHDYQSAGAFTVRLTVSDGVDFALSNPIQIVVGNPPTPEISTPTFGLLFRAGDAISFAGAASDVEDGPLPASALSWVVLFHHDNHTHPHLGPLTNTFDGILDIESSGHDFSDNTAYEIILTAIDSDGLAGVTSVFVFPDKVDLLFDTVPGGLHIFLDGIQHDTPFQLDTLKGFQHMVEAPDQSSTLGSSIFASWTDGGAQAHTIIVPDVNQSYTAFFSQPVPNELLRSTLDDLNAVTAPVAGTGTGASVVTNPANDFVAGQVGNGIQINGSGEYVRFQQTDGVQQNVELTQGTVDFWYQPAYAHTDGVRHTILTIGTSGAAPGGILLEKSNSLNSDELNLRVTDATGQSRGGVIDATAYGWTAGQWVRIRLAWDLTVAAGAQSVRLYLDGVEPPYATVITGPFTMAAESSAEYIYLGQRSATGTFPASGIIDELVILDDAAPPPPVPDATPPVRSDGQPSLVLPSNTTQSILGLTTDEPATCRFSTVSGTNYFSMSNGFATAGGTTHTATLTGLAAGNAYQYYARCIDIIGNINPDDFVISFSVETDVAPPVRGNPQPTGALPNGTIDATVSLDTDEPATCRYAADPNIPFDFMTDTFATTGGVYHAMVIPVSDGNAYGFYVRCTDAASNVNLDDFLIKFYIPQSPLPLLSTSLDSLAAVMFPGAGTGGGASVVTNPANDFVSGEVGNGIRINGSGEYVRFQQTDGVRKNVELTQGTVDFWYQPAYAHTDGVRHTILTIGTTGAAPGGIILEKNNSLNSNELNVRVTDATGQTQGSVIDATAYGWTAGQWVRIRVAWDFTVAAGEQSVRVYLDAVESQYSTLITGPLTMAAESSSQYIYVGQRSATGTLPANGIIDELVIYDRPLAPALDGPDAGQPVAPRGARPRPRFQAPDQLD